MAAPASAQGGRRSSHRPAARLFPEERWPRPSGGPGKASRALGRRSADPGRGGGRPLLATLAGRPAAQTPVAMASGPAPLCGLVPCCLWLLGVFFLVDVSARPANHSSARERAGNREENEILPPDHLNGVKLEMDGHLNKDFHQEVFLGKDTKGFEDDAEPRRSRRKLMVIFSKVDLNTDRKISAKEMQQWIMEKTAEHFQEAIAESKVHFRAVDPDGDGRVSWDEYKVKFLASKGHSEKEVAEKIKNKWELNIDEETQEVLENLKDRWYQADSPPPDLLLTEAEFLSFLHPEHSRGMLQFMVKEIVRDLDQDGDKRLSLPEFISLPVGTVENQQGQDIDDSWVRDRRREFEELIDANHDGVVTMAELEDYMDPMNEYSALNEAKQMIAIADENQNQHLEPEEVLKYSEFFTGSKLVDYARSVHEEF
ncbi:45 kDa calcium-binding protein [Camelus ferus]|uniref:45 kDa calcium-binding protein n=4 Tax=Camelus TaxID=9836 RepID=A0A8B8U847_CAMFR|nr:45 kDa calcium-binding protein isoform X2 [Camelus dromedarius]XP_032350764.1 45 kDa calcium-binding protein [Camelus ferus]